VAALYVQTGGAYYGLPGVDPWDEARDARGYPGPWPVVAHPPCQRWCQLAPVNAARYGHAIGDDGGTFAAALAAVRRWGGVLEHPAFSYAWPAFGLPVPGRGGWHQALDDPGIVTEVDQANYGHAAPKRTWLYAVGVDPLPLDWRRVRSTGAVIGGGVNAGTALGQRKVEKPEASRTPPAFRDVLIALARTAHARVASAS
jgi:hypothetical protein